MSSDATVTAPARQVMLVGIGPTTADALASLQQRFSVVGLLRDTEDEVTESARDAGIEVFADVSLAGLADAVARLDPDVVVVSSYRRIIPESMLRDRPFVNVHYAPLPRYRGRATVNWAIINGEPATAVTVHRMVPGLDAGEILAQVRVPIEPDDTVGALYARLNEVQRRELAEAVERMLAGPGETAGDGEPVGAVQDEAAATYACTRIPEDGEIDWASPTVAVDRLIRALGDPFPGAFTWLGLQRLWIDSAVVPPEAPVFEGRIPGRVVLVDRASGHVDVLTGDGVLRIRTVRLATGPPIAAAEMIRSVHTTLGLRYVDLAARLLELDRQVAELQNRLHAVAERSAAGRALDG